MKKALLIITFFIGLGNVNAQYDASWKETVTFIQNYSNDMYNYNSSSCESEYHEISIKGEELIVKFKFKDGSGEVISKVDLSKLKSITSEGYFFDIKLTGNYIESSFDGNDYSNSHTSNIEIHFCNLEIMERVYFAFKHLTTLALDKRG